MTGRSRTVQIEDLIGSRVVDAEGELLGRVVDAVVHPELGYLLTDLELGRYAWVDRWDLARPLARFFGRGAAPRTVAWTDVDRFERGTLTLKPGCGVREGVPEP